MTSKYSIGSFWPYQELPFEQCAIAVLPFFILMTTSLPTSGIFSFTEIQFIWLKLTAANKCYTKAGQRSAIEQMCFYLSFSCVTPPRGLIDLEHFLVICIPLSHIFHGWNILALSISSHGHVLDSYPSAYHEDVWYYPSRDKLDSTILLLNY